MPHSEVDTAEGFAWVVLVQLDELGVVTRAVHVPVAARSLSRSAGEDFEIVSLNFGGGALELPTGCGGERHRA